MSARHAAVVVFILSFASTLFAADLSGKLVDVQGQVFVRPPGGNEAPGQAGTTVAAGTQVRTGADGTAEIRFDDGSLLKLQKSSSILLSAAKRQKQKNAVVLFFGRLWSKVSPSSSGDTNYEVATPNAVCGVRGTQFETQVGDDGSLRMQVTEGKVAVGSEGSSKLAGAGQQVQADEKAVTDAQASAGQPGYDEWQGGTRERLRRDGEGVVKSIKGKIMTNKEKLESLRARQKELESRRKAAEARARGGDDSAIAEIRQCNQQLAELADQIADIGDRATAEFGAVDHFADLVSDPRFKAVSRKYIEMEAASLRRVRADLDKMVAEGTDISLEAMEHMLDDMSKGKGTLRDEKGSTTKDLFGPNDSDMQMH
jgi:hypothetical protein